MEPLKNKNYETTIYRSNDFSRSMYCHDLGIPIDRIVLHDGVNILHMIQQGWLETVRDGGFNIQETADIISIEGKVRRANKLKLAEKDNFVLKYNDEDKGFHEIGYALYLYTPNCEFEGSYSEPWQDGKTTANINVLKFSLSCEVEDHSLYTYGSKLINEVRLIQKYWTEHTKLGKQIAYKTAELNAFLPNEQYKLTKDQVEKLMEHFDITRKI